jgi:acyl-coenzyme A synthetase/AMP-(fatty) acid ligase
MNVVDPILHFGVNRRNAPALVDGERTITYGDLAELIRRTAGHLAAMGFRPGDRIGLCLKDTSDHVIAVLGVAHMGGVAVPLDWRARANENGRLIGGLGLKCVVAESGARLAQASAVISLDAEWRRDVANAKVFDQPACDPPTRDWNDPFLISATSGSTGNPRFTLMTHLQYRCAMAGMFELMGLAGRHRFLSTLPLYYSGGRNSCIAHLLRGDSVVLYPSLFSPAEYIDLVSSQQITVAAVVPSFVRQLLATDGAEPLLPGLTKLFCTGAPLHPEEKRHAVKKLTPHFYERYGTAETLAISVLRPEDLTERADSVGQPHSFAQIEIVDECDRPLKAGSVGRLRVRGPGLASPLPSQIEEASFNNGWFYPGEIARLDEDGYIFLLGRESDVIMRSGAKIYPAEVERTLIEYPGVIEAAVVSHRGGDNEETAIAFVVTQGTLTAGELIAHCRGQLTPHKVPRQIRFVAELPKNTSGKLDKSALAEYLEQEPGP